VALEHWKPGCGNKHPSLSLHAAPACAFFGSKLGFAEMAMSSSKPYSSLQCALSSTRCQDLKPTSRYPLVATHGFECPLPLSHAMC
jgi:hypothetical protein